jgi:hypothetical protein
MIGGQATYAFMKDPLFFGGGGVFIVTVGFKKSQNTGKKPIEEFSYICQQYEPKEDCIFRL